MNEPGTEQNRPQTAENDAAADAVALTVEQVEEQIRQAEALHRSLSEKLNATARE
ncbi:hypothetical protein [Nesterenkonia muleiensis]|uniref:hypothetical protein n=1 Tax=Nesterenkonia muleiensis TaxID=2282648 RepID=UPI001300941A|nr:hypothetical protein [Nesterenkonia muleiensis]